VRVGALRSALSKFLKEGRLVVVDGFEPTEIKTKALVGALSTLKAKKKALVVDSLTNDNLRMSIRNCKDHAFLPPEGLNVYDLLRHDTLVLSKDAAMALVKRCLGNKATSSEGGDK
jgi:large subunit ribosomal protein L4